MGAAGGGRPGCPAGAGVRLVTRALSPRFTGRTTPAAAAAQRPARATATGAEPTGPGRLGGASRKRGPWAPLCEGRRRGAGQPPTAGSLDACLPAGVPVGPAASPLHFPSGGASRLPPPSSGLLRARPFPTPPAWASVPIGRALPSHPHPPRHFALSPPPPLTSSSSPVRPSAPLHSPPGFADFRPPSASPSSAAASGVLFFPPFGRSW